VTLLSLKHEVDNMLIKNSNLIDNEAFFQGSIVPIIARVSLENGLELPIEQIKFIAGKVLIEYEEERKMVG